MKFRIIVAGAMAGLFAIAGCTGQQLNKAQGIEPQGSAFDQNLYHGYIGLSEAEFQEGDYRDSDAFAMRATESGTQGGVGPEEIDARRLPDENVAELSEARAKLVAALDAGAAQADPARAADAQVNFDCWMQEQEENWQPKDIARCRDNFNVALEGLGYAPVASRAKPTSVRFVVYFDTDKFDVNTDAEAVLAEARSAAEKLGTPIIRISGNADTVGSVDYNQKLSELRAQAVAKVMKSGNTPVRAMLTEAHGELKPALMTADETAERRNRRVEIILDP